MTIKLEAVVATDIAGAIGKDNAIPWKAPKDLQRFRKLTMGRPVIMGYRTLMSIGRPLAGRGNIVLTRKASEAPFPGVVLVHSPAEALREAARQIDANEAAWDRDEVYVIGGVMVYEAFLPYYRGLHLTTIRTLIEDADTFFPVDAFLEAYAKPGRLRLQNRELKPVYDGGFMTVYTRYDIVGKDEGRKTDLADTANHLPWCPEGPAFTEEEACVSS